MIWILFTEAQREAALQQNETTSLRISPRLIDHEGSPHAGLWVAPARVAQGRYAETWSARLADHPRIEANPDDLFLPPEDLE